MHHSNSGALTATARVCYTQLGALADKQVATACCRPLQEQIASCSECFHNRHGQLCTSQQQRKPPCPPAPPAVGGAAAAAPGAALAAAPACPAAAPDATPLSALAPLPLASLTLGLKLGSLARLISAICSRVSCGACLAAACSRSSSAAWRRVSDSRRAPHRAQGTASTMGRHVACCNSMMHAAYMVWLAAVDCAP